MARCPSPSPPAASRDCPPSPARPQLGPYPSLPRWGPASAGAAGPQGVSLPLSVAPLISPANGGESGGTWPQATAQPCHLVALGPLGPRLPVKGASRPYGCHRPKMPPAPAASRPSLSMSPPYNPPPGLIQHISGASTSLMEP